MKIYTYAVIDFNNKISDTINGLEGICVYNISYRDMGIVVSSHSEQIQNITKDHILKYEEIVERLMEDFTVLPMRFLTLFNQEEDVLLMMKEHYSDFRVNLDRLRNKVEFGIKVIWSSETIKSRIIESFKICNSNLAIPDNSPGKSFVKEKFEKYKIDKEFEEEADRCIAIIDYFFSRFIAEKKLEKLKSDNLLLSASYLIEKEKQKDFREAFEHCRERSRPFPTPSDLKFLLSGPWPPYNFVVLTKNANMFNRKPVNQDLAGENAI